MTTYLIKFHKNQPTPAVSWQHSEHASPTLFGFRNGLVLNQLVMASNSCGLQV